MKLPPSSSILIATLAISSSSSCLAAPAGPHSQDSEMSKHSSTNQASCMSSTTPTPSHFSEGQHKRFIQRRSNIMMEREVDASHLAIRDASSTPSDMSGLIESVPIIGPPLEKLLRPMLKNTATAQSLESSGSGSAPNIDPNDMAALQSAIQEVSRVFSSSNLPAPVGSAAGSVTSAIGAVASGLPVSPVAGALSDGDGTNSGAGSSSYMSSGAPGPTQAAAAAAAPSSSGNPSSPPMPGNPPNTPSLALPSLPLPVNSGLPV